MPEVEVSEVGKEETLKDRHGVIELTQDEIMSIDLILTKEKLAQAEERIAAMRLRDAQSRFMDVAKQKAILLARIGDRVGGKIKDARVVGRSKLSFELE